MEIKNTNTTKLCLVDVLLNCIVLAKLQIPNNHSPSHSSNYPHFFRIIRIIQVIPSSSSKFIRNNCNQKHPRPTAVTTVCSAGNGLRGRGPNWFTNHLLFTKWFLDLWFEELYSTWQTKQINKSFAIYKMISWFMIWTTIFNMADQTDKQIICNLQHNHHCRSKSPATGDGRPSQGSKFFAVSSLMFWVECHRVSDQRKESVAFQQFGQGTLSLSFSALAT